MNTDSPAVTTPATKKYVTDLQMWLQLRNVPGERIGEITAEVEAHMAESGESAAEAFGPARQYAKQFGVSGVRAYRARTVVTTLVAAVGGFITADAFFSLLMGQPYAGFPAGWGFAFGLVLLLGIFTIIPINVIVDPRTKKRLKHPRLAVLGTTAVIFGVVLGLTLVAWLFVD